MIKPKTTKKDTRIELESLVDEFLKAKGEIQHVDMGESGLVDGKYNTSQVGFSEPKKDRTPLNHVVSAIQSRKLNKEPTKKVKAQVKPRKKMIYDDFGSPIRWVWVD
ncbi:hypothetical protein OFY17_07065 [Marinomonas sp. C2222]|uniref:Transcriptional regulator SutA RNAP-binding domain-containing protein n=1 Tax=Marinomonas sargassi TaxID=2984494 RepID=A0ABT2YRX4_9GAMM|nr:hypothetical protein [Marinomonas sargassi]MCV2402639.1 hypothetical protein [Marinomonas sargassi]